MARATWGASIYLPECLLRPGLAVLTRCGGASRRSSSRRASRQRAWRRTSTVRVRPLLPPLPLPRTCTRADGPCAPFPYMRPTHSARAPGRPLRTARGRRGGAPAAARREPVAGLGPRLRRVRRLPAVSAPCHGAARLWRAEAVEAAGVCGRGVGACRGRGVLVPVGVCVYVVCGPDYALSLASPPHPAAARAARVRSSSQDPCLYVCFSHFRSGRRGYWTGLHLWRSRLHRRMKNRTS